MWVKVEGDRMRHLWKIVLLFQMLIIAIALGYIESLSTVFYTPQYLKVMWGIIFPCLIIIVPIHNWVEEKHDAQTKEYRFIVQGLVVISIAFFFIVVEDFFAVFFAGLVVWPQGMLWSAMGIAYKGTIPYIIGDWHTPGFQIPYLYFIFLAIGAIFMILAIKYFEPLYNITKKRMNRKIYK